MSAEQQMIREKFLVRDKISFLPPRVPIMFTRDLLAALVDPPEPVGAIRLVSLSGPGSDGFYTPTFEIVPIKS